MREWRYDDQDIDLRKGDEMGRFLLGSTVVMLFPAPPLRFTADWAPARAVRLGEPMADYGRPSHEKSREETPPSASCWRCWRLAMRCACSGRCATAMRRPSGCCRTASAASRPTRSTPASRNCAKPASVSHGGDGYSLTLSGQDLLKRLSDLQAFAVKWQAGQQRKAMTPAPVTAPVAPSTPIAPAATAAPRVNGRMPRSTPGPNRVR